MNLATHQQAIALIQKHQQTINKICTVLMDDNVSAQDGANVLALMAGMSTGLCTDDAKHLVSALAIGWQFGAAGDVL